MAWLPSFGLIKVVCELRLEIEADPKRFLVVHFLFLETKLLCSLFHSSPCVLNMRNFLAVFNASFSGGGEDCV